MDLPRLRQISRYFWKIKRGLSNDFARGQRNCETVTECKEVKDKEKLFRTLNRLERLSLVGFEVNRGKEVLEVAVKFAVRLREANIDGTVQPLTTVLEKEHIPLREDETVLLANADLVMDAILKSLGSSFVNIGERGLTYGPQGRILRRNLENYWFLHCVTMPNINVFLTSTDKYADALNELKNNCMYDVPFGLASIEDSKSMENQSLIRGEYKSLQQRVAKLCIFNDASSSKDLFHRKQRERKVWWRKLALNPNRFVLAEEKQIKNVNTVQIEAHFTFAKVIVESISYRRDIRKIFGEVGNVQDNVEDIEIVEHVTLLDWGCLTLLCDGFRSSDSLDSSSKIYIHPKLAPYKVAFRLGNEITSDLERFILYLNNILKMKGIDTLLSNNEKSLQTYHVPFIIDVCQMSLKNGLVRVINCSTTIGETVHITNLGDYIASRCR